MARLLTALFLILAISACDSAGDDLGGEADAGVHQFQLLDAMLQIELSYRAIEPNLRDTSALAETGRAASEVLAWSDDPTFDSFVETDRFYSDAAAFLALRDEMKAGAQRVLDATESEDLDEVREGFIDLKQSCIRCHKRYSPSF